MKKDNKLKGKNKIKLSTVIIFVAIVLLIGSGIFFFLTSEDESNNLTILEKQWIEKNKSTLIDFKVPSNLSILSSNGEGVLFDFMNKFEKGTNLKLNKVSYTYPGTFNAEDHNLGIYVLKSSDEVLSSDIFIMEDNYVLFGTTTGFIRNEKEIYGKTVGILEADKKQIQDYLNSNVEIKTYSNLNDLYKAVSTSDVAYAIAPRYYILQEATTNQSINIKYSFNNITNKIVLRLGTDDKVNEIVSKYMKKFINDDLRISIEESLMNYYVENTNTTDIEKASLTSKVFKYGYVNDGIYNSTKQNKLYGVAGEYINTLSNMADMSFEYISFSSIDKLKEALNKGEIDIAFINYDIGETNYSETISPFNSTFVVLANKYQSITDADGISNRKIYVEENSYLSNYLSNNYKIAKETYKDEIKAIDDFSLIVMDECKYEYFLSSNRMEYSLLFKEYYENDYHFAINKDEKVLYNLISYVLEKTDNNDFKTIGINNLVKTSKQNQNFKYIYMIILVIILVPIIAVALVSIITKNAKKIRTNKKEDVLKYNDLLTSLKNRNYLNANINNWDNTKIYPRTIIMIDLNNLKYVNDNYGHEEGNNLIKKAAAILINTQLEKSEIIRTDGNEFLIYLIGYSKSQINTYITKLSKAFESLPHGFGAAVGYSIINDEIKTIDDAINEATIEMRMDKEQNYR